MPRVDHNRVLGEVRSCGRPNLPSNVIPTQVGIYASQPICTAEVCVDARLRGHDEGVWSDGMINFAEHPVVIDAGGILGIG